MGFCREMRLERTPENPWGGKMDRWFYVFVVVFLRYM